LDDQLDKDGDLRRDLQGTLKSLARMQQKAAPGKMEYRFMPYSPGYSMVIVDRETRNGRIIVEFFGFRNEFITDRMHIELQRGDSQRWFEYWADQFEKMWTIARQPEGAETHV
jgi:hypothetical protein